MTPTDSSYPIRDAFRRFFPNYAELHPFLPMEQLKVASSIMRCKTGELGYNVSYCDDCGYPLVHAVSCNNRSCPCCQAPLEKKWELERNTELISGIAYFHVVFTIPHDLNTLVKANLKRALCRSEVHGGNAGDPFRTAHLGAEARFSPAYSRLPLRRGNHACRSVRGNKA